MIGLSILDSVESHGWDTALVSARWLAVELGVEEKAARSALNAAIELRWLKVVTKRPGGSTRVRLRPQLTSAQGATADEYTFAVEALAAGTPQDDPVAELVAVAGHAAVGHGVGAKAWLAALAHQADVEPRVLGVTGTGSRAPWRKWLSVLPTINDDIDTSVVEMLDAYTMKSGAGDRRREAMTAREEAAERRRVETEAHRALVTKVNRALDRLLTAHPVPKPHADRRLRVAWGEALTATIAQNGVDEDIRKHLARSLASRMVRRGYVSSAAGAVADHVCGLEQKEVAA